MFSWTTEKKYLKVLKQVLIHTVTHWIQMIQTVYKPIESSVANDFRSTGYIPLTFHQLTFWLQECDSSNSTLKHVSLIITPTCFTNLQHLPKTFQNNLCWSILRENSLTLTAVLFRILPVINGISFALSLSIKGTQFLMFPFYFMSHTHEHYNT